MQASLKEEGKEKQRLQASLKEEGKEQQRLQGLLSQTTQKLTRLQGELAQASTLAAVTAVEQVPGLADAELRALEELARGERERRQALAVRREIAAEIPVL